MSEQRLNQSWERPEDETIALALPPDLGSLESALAALAPSPGKLETDRVACLLATAARRRSPHRSAFVRPFAAGAAVGIVATLLLALCLRPDVRVVERVVYVAPSTETPAPEEAAAADPATEDATPETRVEAETPNTDAQPTDGFLARLGQKWLKLPVLIPEPDMSRRGDEPLRAGSVLGRDLAPYLSNDLCQLLPEPPRRAAPVEPEAPVTYQELMQEAFSDRFDGRG